MATNELDSAKGLKDLFVLLLIEETEGIIPETDTFYWGKEKSQKPCCYAGKDNKAISPATICKALGPGKFDYWVLKEVARKTVKISNTRFLFINS